MSHAVERHTLGRRLTMVLTLTAAASVAAPSARAQDKKQMALEGRAHTAVPFETFDQMYSLGDTEAIEIFPMGSSVPLSYQVARSGCGMMVVWFRSL